jgi:hypothetical protein
MAAATQHDQFTGALIADVVIGDVMHLQHKPITTTFTAMPCRFQRTPALILPCLAGQIVGVPPRSFSGIHAPMVAAVLRPTWFVLGPQHQLAGGHSTPSFGGHVSVGQRQLGSLTLIRRATNLVT